VGFKIPDLETFKEAILDSVVIGLHVDSSLKGVNETGIAILPIHTIPQINGGLGQFHDENHVRIYTIQIPRKNSGRERCRYRTRAVVQQSKDIAPAVLGFLSKTPGLTTAKPENVILVGYDMIVEFRWISKNPGIASYFTSWVDVQELVSKQRGTSDWTL
jgi:hypothetical protein